MQMSPEAFALLREYVRIACGLVLSEEKEYFIRQRLEPLAERFGCRSMDEFVHRLRHEESEELRSELISSITTNETSFFRDDHPWTAIKESILPELALRAQKVPTSERHFRFWSAASATGQEAFSLAMVIDEFVREHPENLLRNDHFSITATDISPRMIIRAGSGVFTEYEVGRGLGMERRQKYFHKDGSHYVACDTLRRMIEFRELNLMDANVELGMFDVVLCRNVLIYLDAPVKTSVFQTIDKALYPHGWLLLGATENVYGQTDRFVSDRYGPTILFRKPGMRKSGRLRKKKAE